VTFYRIAEQQRYRNGRPGAGVQKETENRRTPGDRRRASPRGRVGAKVKQEPAGTGQTTTHHRQRDGSEAGTFDSSREYAAVRWARPTPVWASTLFILRTRLPPQLARPDATFFPTVLECGASPAGSFRQGSPQTPGRTGNHGREGSARESWPSLPVALCGATGPRRQPSGCR
jgi:hypothetical protein